MASLFISKAHSSTTVDDIRTKFEELDLGIIGTIDMKEYVRDGSTFRKFWIHYSKWSTEPHAAKLMERVMNNQTRQMGGEIVPTGDIPRIVYGSRRTGNGKPFPVKLYWWQVFACKTPEERRAEQESKLDKPKVRIVM